MNTNQPAPAAAKGRSTAVKAGSTEKIAHRVARDIVRSIYERHMTVGERFLSEAEAQKEYGVSRGTLREALRFLQILGVIEIRAGLGGGYFVSMPESFHLASILALLLQFSGATLESLIEGRSVIEPGIAEMAATNATDEDIQAIQQKLIELEGALGDFMTFRLVYQTFWTVLARATHNPLLEILWPALNRITETMPPKTPTPPNMRPQALGRARALSAAIMERNPAKARSCTLEITEVIRTLYRTQYKKGARKVISWAHLSAG